jgi:uncharacterized protein (TIRG00374 family)
MTRLQKLTSSTHIRTGIGLVVSAAFLLLAFWKVEWKDLAHSLATTDPWLLTLACLLYTASILSRSASWRKILSPVKVVSLRDMFAYECIGYLANNVMPMRLGELVRVVLVAERQAIPKSSVLSSIALERLFDMLLLFLAGLAVPVFVALPLDAAYGTWLVGGLAVCALLGLWLLVRRPTVIKAFWTRLRDRLNPRWRARAENIIAALFEGLSILRDGRLLSAALFWLAVSWALAGLTTYVLMRATHLAVPWVAALTQLVIVNLGAMIPSSPGGLGVIHYLTILTLSLWAIGSTQALAFALLFHGVPYLLVVGLGAYFLFREGLRLTYLRQSAENARTPEGESLAVHE